MEDALGKSVLDITDEERKVMWFLAHVSERIGRYEDCLQLLGLLVPSEREFVESNRRLVARAFQTVMERNLKAIMAFKDAQSKPEAQASKGKIRVAGLIAKIENEQVRIHANFLSMLKTNILPGLSDPNQIVLLHKTIGDAFVYIADIVKDDQRKAATATAKESYETALKVAEQDIGFASDIYIACALNYSTFEYKFMSVREHPIYVLRRAYSKATSQMKDVSPDGRAMLHLMKSNIASWTAE